MQSDRQIFERGSSLFYLTALVLFLALVLGGGTRPGFFGDVVLQYVSLPLLLIAGAKAASSHNPTHRRALVFCGAIALVPLLQLIPLPPALRALLPGYHWLVETSTLIDSPHPYWPISVVPHATWLAALSLMPPMAVFLGTMMLSQRERTKLAYLVLAICGFSVFLGLLQLSQGPNSGLRFFARTNVLDAVGFFANRNHYAALLYCGTMLAAWYVLQTLRSVSDQGLGKVANSRFVIVLVAACTLFAIIVVAQAMARSRAGIILSMVALLMVLPMVLADRRNEATATGTLKIVYAVAAFAVVFSLQFALLRIMERFEADPLQDARIAYARTTFGAAMSYLPFGAGTGSFVWVFPQFEKQTDLISAFANRAHNDFVEAALESGVLAVLLMLVFAVWFVRAGIRVWSTQDQINSSYLSLMRAAWVIVALLALHSFVDYPLRTSAMASIAAFACALMLPARHHHRDHCHDAENEARPAYERAAARSHPQASDTVPGVKAAAPAEPRAPPRPHQRWEAPVEWPEEWKPKAGGTTPKAASGWDVTTPKGDGGKDGGES
jgi:O-antigen ligase